MSQLSQNGEPISENIGEPSQRGPVPTGKERHFSITVNNPKEDILDFW